MKKFNKIISTILAVIMCAMLVVPAFAVRTSAAGSTYSSQSATLGRPSKLTAAQNKNAVKLTWSKVSGATGYRIYQAVSGKWKALGNVKGNTCTINKLRAGTKYTFAVRAYKIVSGKVVFAAKYTTIQTATKTAAPASVTTSRANGKIALSWSKVSGATGYRVYVRQSGKWVKLITTTARKYTVSNTKANSQYVFAVRPYIKTGGNVIWGDYATVTVYAVNSSGIPSTKAEAVSAYNKAINNLKAYNGVVVISQEESIDLEVTDCSAQAITSTINSIVQNFVGEKDVTTTFYKNRQFSRVDNVSGETEGAEISRRITDCITPLGRNVSLLETDVKAAAIAKQKDGGYKITLMLPKETTTFNGVTSTGATKHSKAVDVLELGALDLLPVEITSAKTVYSGATLEATLDASGRLVELDIDLPMCVNATGKISFVSASVCVNAEVDTEYEIVYA